MNELEPTRVFPAAELKLSLEGLSLSGIRTAISVPELGISFDVAQGYPFSLRMKNFFITHGHLDHAAGIPFIISQKAMHGEPPGHFYMPASLVEPLLEIMRLWAKIEDHQYETLFHPMQPLDKIQLNPQYFIRCFKTVHRIDSLGYTLFSSLKKLKPEWQGADQQQLINAKSKGESIDEIIETPLITFTGDTQIEFLDNAPWIRQSKVLIMEATYLDDAKTIAHARKWGHTHLDEIIPELDGIASEKIVLIHFSSRYSDSRSLKILQEKIPEKHRDRVMMFPGR